ncbi:aminotransferase class I/II-fold pyridoxal phosphate-dependent enzyme [Streptomyces griseocarneus]|uniref:aminotransferase class I/II-fold pyridoxal phosphate-dependent enzyme n=1 Tax=Streptomyces griseocarneus TaxID=51201 RepID=UPI00167DAC41|nr:aminotransferase class I/II-fold pyridoxal phosphate-dependent enzyme [Streptomyces griseocarneus]MBZ6476325.1 aminotransferase class I/II-fold pyridoxal phosphate-dependent enzyme [Streptomyces griseocarneus]GHG78172.1 2-amino-3-ketobutyrate CoA ligase [Streptomyces griseocarneus]
MTNQPVITPATNTSHGIIDRLLRNALQTGDARRMYEKTIAALDGSRVRFTDGTHPIMLATYDYLGLLDDPRVNQAAKDAIDTFGTGGHGSRVWGASLTLHRQLEHEIAEWVGREAALVFASGYVTNYSAIASLAGPGDWVLSDQRNHASIVDGCLAAKNAGAQVKVYRHNDPAHLEDLLAQAPPEAAKLVVTDGVFSMDGNLVDLPAVSDLCRRYGALLFLDEAHSLGVVGPHGGGTQDHYGLPDAADLVMGTLSKSIPASGGFVAGPRDIIEALRFTTRAYVYTGAPSPPNTAAALTAIRLVRREGDQRRARLHRNLDHLRQRVRKEGLRTTDSRSAIVPVILGENAVAIEVSRLCQQEGLYVLAAVPPLVPAGTARLRLNVTAAQSLEDIDTAVDIITDAVRRVTAP